MELYTEYLESLALVAVPMRVSSLSEAITRMRTASERDIVAARWMAGGALLTSDEPLLDQGERPDPKDKKLPPAPEDVSMTRAKMLHELRKFRTFTPATEQAFAETLEHILEHAEEGIAYDIYSRVYRRGFSRENMCRYLRRQAHTVPAFATCAGKLYACKQRLRSIYNTNRRSNDLAAYENAAVETLLEQLAGGTPPGFWHDFPAPGLADPAGHIRMSVIDITGLHATLLNYNIETFTVTALQDLPQAAAALQSADGPPRAETADTQTQTDEWEPPAPAPPGGGPPAPPDVRPTAAERQPTGAEMVHILANRRVALKKELKELTGQLAAKERELASAEPRLKTLQDKLESQQASLEIYKARAEDLEARTETQTNARRVALQTLLARDKERAELLEAQAQTAEDAGRDSSTFKARRRILEVAIEATRKRIALLESAQNKGTLETSQAKCQTEMAQTRASIQTTRDLLDRLRQTVSELTRKIGEAREQEKSLVRDQALREAEVKLRELREMGVDIRTLVDPAVDTADASEQMDGTRPMEDDDNTIHVTPGPAPPPAPPPDENGDTPMREMGSAVYRHADPLSAVYPRAKRSPAGDESPPAPKRSAAFARAGPRH